LLLPIPSPAPVPSRLLHPVLATSAQPVDSRAGVAGADPAGCSIWRSNGGPQAFSVAIVVVNATSATALGIFVEKDAFPTAAHNVSYGRLLVRRLGRQDATCPAGTTFVD